MALLALSPYKTSTWNPNDFQSELLLSNSNQTVKDGPFLLPEYHLCRSLIGKKTGKWYAEILGSVVNSGAEQSGFGVCTSAISLTDYPGGSSGGGSGQGYSLFNDGKLYTNGTNTATVAGYATGNYLQIALDLDNGKLWFGVNNTWTGTGNPSTGANPQFSTVPTTGNKFFYIAITIFNKPSTFTLRTKNSTFSGTIPTGFSSWSNF